MKLFYKLLKQDPNTREGITITTSALGIVVNTVLAIVKILIGVAVGSIAIISGHLAHHHCRHQALHKTPDQKAPLRLWQN